jgi:LPS export ABC transporter protein LptC
MTRKQKRLLLLTALCTSLGLIFYKVTEHLWLQQLNEFERNPVKLLELVPKATLQVKDFRRSKIEGGRKVWEVTGEEATYLKAEQEAVIKRPWFVFYRENGETMEVTGDEGHLYFSDREMEKMQLQGAVQVNFQGFVLRTDEVLYYQSQNHVVSPGMVSLSSDGLELEGGEMEILLQEEKIRLGNRVKTTIQPDRLQKKNYGPVA